MNVYNIAKAEQIRSQVPADDLEYGRRSTIVMPDKNGFRATAEAILIEICDRTLREDKTPVGQGTPYPRRRHRRGRRSLERQGSRDRRHRSINEEGQRDVKNS